MEIDEVKEYYANKYEHSTGSGSGERKLVEQTKPKLHELATGQVVILDSRNNEPELNEDDLVAAESDLDHKAYNEFEAEEDDEDEFDEDEDDSIKPDEVNEEPYIIPYETFIDQKKPFKTEVLYYYRFDDTICTPTDKVIDDPEDVLGFEWMLAIKRQATVFVRNEVNKTDYEINALNKDYIKDVQVRQETDREKRFRQTARQKEAMDAFSEERAQELADQALAEYGLREDENEAPDEELAKKDKVSYNRQQGNQKIRYDLAGKNKLEESLDE